MAWYNQYRPQNFESVIGQKLVKSVLQNSIKTGKIKHGYLLSGSKGVGKTTLARIFANELNELKENPQASLDIIELDAASNTGVDNIRQLIESAKTPPFAGKYKIYIIDEVHMLSKAAMSALLKILEEPPAYLIFLLATTNPEKLIPTVLSRLTKLALGSHSEADLVENLTKIANLEKVQIDTESLQLIAKRAGGGQRDAINLLETLSSYGLESYTIDQTSFLLGLLPAELLTKIAVAFESGTNMDLKGLIVETENKGMDGETFLGQFLEFLLESSFEKNQFASLVMPIAELLDLRLPINTVSGAFALILAKYSAGSHQGEKKTAVKTANWEEPSTQTHPEPELDKVDEIQPTAFITQEITDVNTALETNVQEPEPTKIHNDTLPEIKPALEQKIPTSSAIETFENTETFESVQSQGEPISKEELPNINFIKGQKDCPTIISIILADTVVENISGNQVTISVSNPMNLSNFNVQKNKEYLQSKISEKLGQNVNLKIVKREMVKSPKSQLITEKKEIEQPTGQNTKSVLQSKVDSLESSSEPKQQETKTVTNNNVFYSVYKAFPEGFENTQNVPIRTQDIPSPPVVETPNEPSYDDEISSMFGI